MKWYRVCIPCLGIRVRPGIAAGHHVAWAGFIWSYLEKSITRGRERVTVWLSKGESYDLENRRIERRLERKKLENKSLSTNLLIIVM